MKSSPSIWRYVVNVKSTVKILSIFVAFLENMNFSILAIILKVYMYENLYSFELHWLPLLSLWTSRIFFSSIKIKIRFGMNRNEN